MWNYALDRGTSVIKGMKNLVRVITYPDYSQNKCPLCDIPDLGHVTLAEHLTIEHTRSDSSWNTLFDSLTTMDTAFSNHVLCFVNVLLCIAFNYLSLNLYSALHSVCTCVSCQVGLSDMNFEQEQLASNNRVPAIYGNFSPNLNHPPHNVKQKPHLFLLGHTHLLLCLQ